MRAIAQGLLLTGLAILTSAAGPAGPAGRGTSVAARAPDSPAATVQGLARAYEDKSVAGLAALLTADYRFHQSSSEQMRFITFMDGFTREFELESATNLFRDAAPGARKPTAASIRVKLNGVSQGPDPEHPDSSAHYQVVSVSRFQMSLKMTNGDSIKLEPHLHVFHVVRGDAAVRAEGQPADSSRWYIRRWLEDLDQITLALTAQKQDCADPAPRPVAPAREEGADAVPAAGPRPPVELAIHPLGNPACPLMPIMCDLPDSGTARIEVFDVTGRLVSHRDVEVTAPGTMSVEAGANARLEPGVYWVRLSQNARRPSTRMVVVTR